MVAAPYILNLSCADKVGIVAAITRCLAEHNFNISTSHQFSDPLSNHFFIRISFTGAPERIDALRASILVVSKIFCMHWKIYDALKKPRLLLLVSRFGHCLNDLLYRQSIGALNVEFPVVASNHEDFRQLCEANKVPFVHLHADDARKEAREQQILKIIQKERIELVVLARYMQVFSRELCQELPGRAINIHHSFLPSFKGAKPYHQAYSRGVKLIGATAHYVTPDLDEGPIIEQEVSRVDHAMNAEALMAAGRDVESVVLARAVQAHVERRVFLNGSKTVVFR